MMLNMGPSWEEGGTHSTASLQEEEEGGKGGTEFPPHPCPGVSTPHCAQPCVQGYGRDQGAGLLLATESRGGRSQEWPHSAVAAHEFQGQLQIRNRRAGEPQSTSVSPAPGLRRKGQKQESLAPPALLSITGS